MVHLSVHVLQTTQFGHEGQELGRREEGRRRFRFGHDADVGLEVLRVRNRVDAQHLDAPDAGTELPREEFDEGGFACSVGPKHTEEFALMNPDVQRVQGHEIPVPLADVLGVDEELTVGHALPVAADPYERTEAATASTRAERTLAPQRIG